MKRLIILCLALAIALGIGIYLNRPMQTVPPEKTVSKFPPLSPSPAIENEQLSSTQSNGTTDHSTPHLDSPEQNHYATEGVTDSSPNNTEASMTSHSNKTTETLAEQLDSTLKRNASVPLEATEAHHFVNDDQLIILPDVGAVSVASLEEWIPNAPNSGQTTPQETSSLANPETPSTPAQSTESFGVGAALKPFKPSAPSTSSDTLLTPVSPSSVNGDKATLDTPLLNPNTPHQVANGMDTNTALPPRTVRLKELLDEPESKEKRVFYLHSVNQGDHQGLWGIVQTGLTTRFANGIVLENQNHPISALIPPEADEQLADKTSSFLGKRLYQKVANTYVFNYQQGVIGKNPNTIHPGQQLIIVAFTESELLDIYQQFAAESQMTDP
jgi:hypothetical protein